MKIKSINQHYNEEVNKYSSSPKSTMPDLYVRNLEIQKIYEILSELTEKKVDYSILEVGCGNGYTASKLTKKISAKFFGIDANKNMIKLALEKKNNVTFKVDNILNTKIKDEKFDIVFSERCLINLTTWESQMKALRQIHRILKKGGYFIMLEAFDDGLKELNDARTTVNLEKIQPAWHNFYFNKKKFETFIAKKFEDQKVKPNKKIRYDNFLSSYYFGSRVIYPALINGKKNVVYNNKFVKYFSLINSVGNYSPLQVCVLKKI